MKKKHYATALIASTFIYVLVSSDPAATTRHNYETDEPKFYNGEILLPDYVHTDTLIVTDADFLNRMIIADEYNIASDGDINDLLTTATVKK